MAAAQRPRGVFYGYYMIPGLALICWVGYWMYLGVLGAQVTPLTKEFGWSRAEIGLGYTIGATIAGFGYPIWGAIIDRFGARRTMFFGAIGTALGHFIWAISTGLWMYYLGWIVLFPFTTFITYPTATKIIGWWFVRRRGTMMSLMTVAVGTVYMGTTIIVWLIDSFGFRTGHIVMGIFCIVVVVPVALLLVRERPEPMGWRADGAPPPMAGGADSSPRPVAGGSSAASAPIVFTVGQGLRTLAIYIIGLAGLAGAYALVMQTSYQVPFLEEMGVSRVMAGAILGFMGLISIGGRFLGGFLADRFGRGSERFFWCAGLLLEAVGLVVLTQAKDMSLVWVFLAIFGTGMGFAVPLPMAMIASYYGAPSYATMFGIYMFITRFGTLSAPVVAGWIWDTTGSFVLAFWIGAAVTLVFGLILLIARPPAPPKPTERS